MYKIKELISPKVSVAKSIKQINILKKLLFAFSNKLITNILIVINESLTISIRILSVVYTYYMIIILMSN